MWRYPVFNIDILQQKNYNEKLEVMSLQGSTKCKVNCYI
jgi:hypothetical protein